MQHNRIRRARGVNLRIRKTEKQPNKLETCLIYEWWERNNAIRQTGDGNARKQLGVAVFIQSSEIYDVGTEGWRMEGEEETKRKGHL